MSDTQPAQTGRRLIDKALVRRLAATGVTTSGIARATGRPKSSITRLAWREGIKIKPDPNPGSAVSPFWAANDPLLRAEHALQTPYPEIARKLGVSKNAVVGRINRLGLSEYNPCAHVHEFWTAHADTAVALVADGLSYAQIGAQIGATRRAVSDFMRRRRKAATAKPPPRAKIEFPAHGHCLFGFGDVGKANFHWCSQPCEPDRSYCPQHQRRCYRQASPVAAVDLAVTRAALDRVRGRM